MSERDDDVFEPNYSPSRIEFWLHHWEELDALAYSPRSSAHIAEHLNREWMLLQVRRRACLCAELHGVDQQAVDPACTHEPTGRAGFRAGPETALCIVANLRRAAARLPQNWLSVRTIMDQQGQPLPAARPRSVSREPQHSRWVAVKMMAVMLGWTQEQVA